MSDLDSYLDNLVCFEARVIEILGDGSCVVEYRKDKKEIVSAPNFGGIRDCGVFYHPNLNDRVVCARVHPGASGVTQILTTIASPSNSTRHDDNDGNVVSGASPYPSLEVGDVRVTSNGGAELFLKGSSLSSSAGVITASKNGIYIDSDQDVDSVTLVSDVYQGVSNATRTISGNIIRTKKEVEIAVPVGHKLKVFSKLTGDKIGYFDGEDPQPTALLGKLRNMGLSEHRVTINEFCEDDAMTGFDLEKAYATSENIKQYEDKSHLKSLDSRSTLNLAPHQLIETIGGNVVNSAGESLDINYGTVRVGDAEGRPKVSSKEYEKDRLLSRRGIGYHFQLSTNSISTKKSNDKDNFIFSIDKKGLLKVSVPASTLSDNVIYPTKAEFGHESGQVITKPLNPSVTHRVPVTLRDRSGDMVVPGLNIGAFVDSKGVELYRSTGVRYSNNSKYFHGFSGTDKSGAVRVNFTAHHNMYAAAEMLIANTITEILIPQKVAVCPGFVVGTPINEPFERLSGSLNKDGVNKDCELPFMSTVVVKPQNAAIYPGGETTVSGKIYSELDGENPYSNDFSITKDEKNLLGTEGESDKVDPGGKSANINFEGAIDLSVGKDNFDEKSIVLDTAGSMIAWLGKDKNGRSLVLQTDGAIAINAGGQSVNSKGETSFLKGRFDLRVNVNDKGLVGQKFSPQEARHQSDYVISISEKGLVIAGMHPNAPMVIRNAGDLHLESCAKLSLAGQMVEIREGNAPPRKPENSNSAQHQAPATVKTVSDQLTCVTEIISNLTES